jgi:hypothetical protein
MYDISGIHLPQSDASADRRRDFRVNKIQLRAIDGRLIGRDCRLICFNRSSKLVCRRELRVELLFRDDLILYKSRSR